MIKVVEEIHPKPQIGKNVIIQFVPIARDPLGDFDPVKKESSKISWFDSMAVLRIIVKPTRSDVEYCYPVRKGENILKFQESYRYQSILDCD